MKIGIDIDGVLTDLHSHWLGMGSKFCYEHHIEANFDPTQYDHTNMFGITEEQAKNLYQHSFHPYINTTPARMGAKEVMQALKEKHEIYIITARDNDEQTRQETITWLEKNEIPYDHIAFPGENKLPYCKENQIELIIEDSPANIQMLSKEIPVFCYYTPYNAHVEGKNITTVYTWYDIASKLEK